MSSYIYIQKVEGGVGIIGTNSTPTLLGVIQSIPYSSDSIAGLIYGQSTTSGTSNISGSILGFTFDTLSGNLYGNPINYDITGLIYGCPIYHTHTDSLPLIYVELPIGGVGLIQQSITPDLRGAITSRLFESGEESLSGIILATRSGSSNLNGYITVSFSGSDEMYGTITGYVAKNLIGYVVGSIADSKELGSFAEAVPPVDLSGTLEGYDCLDLYGSLECVEPVSLSGDIYAIQRTDLLGTVSGFEDVDLFGSISGIHEKGLSGLIWAIKEGTSTLSGNIRGLLGQNILTSLSGYIVSSMSGYNSISGNLYGMAFKDISGTIESIFNHSLSGSIDGDMPGGLSGSIDSTGQILDLNGYIIPSKNNSSNISGNIDGTAVLDLMGVIDSNTPILIGEILPIYTPLDTLSGNLYGFTQDSLSGTIEPNSKDLLEGNIFAIEPSELKGIITPKVFYIDSYIPINTYPFNEIKAVINGDLCDHFSDFAELGAIIKGTYPSDLTGSIIAVAGQYAIASDQFEVILKNNTEFADWIFFIADQPAYATNYCTLILANSPLSDISGYIEGVYPSTSLSGSISPYYIPPVAREGLEIGEWVNTKTGERKLLKIMFNGNAQDFYYSSEGHITYSHNSSDFLEITVETYRNIGSSNNSLLAQKVQTKKCKVTELDSFKSIDSAIKYGILRAAGEINQELYGYIEAIGGLNDLEATIDPLDSRKIKSLSGTIIPVGNLPDIQGIIEATGGISDIGGYIQPSWEGNPYSDFFDIDGYYYQPSLVYSGGQYSVILTKTEVSGTLGLSKPSDLFVAISGVAEQYLEATVTGIL